MIQYLLVLPLFICFVHSFVKIDFSVSQHQAAELRLSKRYESLVLANKINIYGTVLSIGSGRENVSVFVDTGSADLWVMGNDVQCLSVTEFNTGENIEIPDIFNDIDEDYSCTTNGTFNSDESDTFHESSDGFVIGYADGSAATGSWGHDDVRFGNSTVSQLRFAIAKKASVSDGILGIGIADGYDNFPVELRKQRLINRVAYSLFLNSSDAVGGSILFGAIDHAKYYGTLTTVPLTNDNEFNINVTYQGSNYSILLDTGSTFSILPDEWISEFGTSLNGTFDSDEQVYEIDCLSTGDFFDFSIGGVNFSIPVEQVLVEHNDKCYLGIMSNSVVGGGMLFGFDILRSMYLVYDLEGLTISVAPVIYTTDEDIQEFLSSDEDEEELDPSTSSSTASSSTASSSTASSGDANLLSQNPTNWGQVLLAIIPYFL